MFRAGVSRHVLRSLNAANPASRFITAPVSQQWRSQLCTVSRRPQVLSAVRPTVSQTIGLARYASEKTPQNTPIDLKHEAEIARQKLQPEPSIVSSDSSVRHVSDEVGAADEGAKETEMLAGVKQDLQTIRDTFSLQEVPREAYYMGLAGVLPYLATSLSTVYCAWEINHAADSGVGFLMSEKTADLLLQVIEPLQIGYGAVIISFLGAIHWGLEWAGYDGQKGYARYNIGVLATAFAWPTILMPVEYALISQFLVFNFLYYADSRATKRGWAPPWYGVYRFVLTFIVGSALVVSLIGRGQLADRIGKAPAATDRIQALQQGAEEEFQDEVEARRRLLGDESEGDDDEEEDSDDEGGDDEEE